MGAGYTVVCQQERSLGEQGSGKWLRVLMGGQRKERNGQVWVLC